MAFGMSKKTTKHKVASEAVCSECIVAREYYGQDGISVEAWARKHAEEFGHIVTIHETHDVYFNDSGCEQ